MENVLLLFGGKSYEHDISIVSASQIFSNVRLEEYRLVPVYISKNNRFYLYKNREFNLKDFIDFNEEKPKKCFCEVLFLSNQKGILFARSCFKIKEVLKSSLAINACHGGFGEDGKLVAFLHENGIYCSSGSVESLGISMNKMLFKLVMKGAKVPVVEGVSLSKSDYMQNREIILKNLENLSFPLVFKPVLGGSSIGLFVAKSKEEFDEKIASAFEFDENVLVEKFVANAREFNVAVMGNDKDFIVSEIDEPKKLKEILTFEDKYLSGQKSKKGIKTSNSMASQERSLPADISKNLELKIKKYAAYIFEMLGLSGVVRIDFLYDEKSKKLYVCEVNAVPGSLSYYFFARGEVLLDDFVMKLIDIAKSKTDKQNLIKHEFITNILN